MLLIYASAVTNRLQYIAAFIFSEQMGLAYTLTSNVETFRQYEGAKINYSASRLAADECWIGNHTLLFENEIQPQSISCFDINGYRAFFKTESDWPFDIFAAAFYLLSRYEEYLPHHKDTYGRYAHENAIAFKEGFLQLPLINIWIRDFAEKLKRRFPAIQYSFTSYQFVPTYDIDIAWSYKHKGLLRNAGAFFRAPSVERIKVLTGLQQDPFDVYHWLDDLHQKNNLKPLYFFLTAQKNSHYDKNILPRTTGFRQLVKQHAALYPTGIHPSWQSGDNFLLLKQEKKILEQLMDKPVTISRQHYIRFHLPSGYRRLTEAGIADDYSMGYGSINGFRASVAASFYWYDLEKDQASHLRVHPFCFMDANAFYEQHLTAEKAYEEAMQYVNSCKAVKGTLISIWHNNFLGTDENFSGWRSCYERFISQARP